MTMVSSQRFVRLIIVSKHLNVLCYWVAMNASSWSAVPGTWLSISGSPNRCHVVVHELTVADQLSQVLVDSLGVGMNRSSLTLLPREIDNQFGERGIESSLLACN
ncbi:Uncharacterized protein HZ326_12575 [Fusarium oxysporum f. sp. albedinis]|nr:Uncharacterized protein HZ326_12575 [Fusarium oxysporum f. sp. albedinis]